MNEKLSPHLQSKVQQLKDRKLLVHDNIYRIKIEPSLGCSRDCEFCGMTRKTVKLMSIETYECILKQIPPSVKRLEFILHGEPTINPNLLVFFRMTKERYPNVQIAVSTNGWRFLGNKYDPDYLFEMFEAGANVVQVTLYDEESHQSFIKLYDECVHDEVNRFEENDVKIKDLYNSHDNLFKFKGSGKKELIYVREYEGQNAGSSMQRRFHTFGGNIPVEIWKKYSVKYPDFTAFPLTGKGKSCTNLLKFVSIGATGDLYMCCRDAAHSVTLGNVRSIDINDFWVSDRVQKFRYALKATRRDLFASCFLCSRFQYRDPLYPYWGEEYNKEECIEEIKATTFLRDDVLLDNLIKYREMYPNKVPEHILEEIDKAIGRRS